MASHSSIQTDKLWPGYVAAVASLLLGLLLVVAVLAVSISQIGSVHESYHQAVSNLGLLPKDEAALARLRAGISDEIMPREPPTPARASGGGLKITFIEENIEPTPEQQRQIFQALRALQRQNVSIRISASLPAQDFLVRRMVYARLWAVRAMAFEAGFAQANVQMAIDTDPQANLPLNGITLHVVALRP